MVHTSIDQQGYDQEYKQQQVNESLDRQQYIVQYEKLLRPFYRGGPPKGFLRSLAVSRLFEAVRASGKEPRAVTILDAGCGTGGLSVYLACKGYNVVGVDISQEGCAKARMLAASVGVADNCYFHAESLGDMSVPSSSIDFIIGHAALHHFIKYEGVPHEFARVMKSEGQGFFTDAFGENPLYHIFHDREKMQRLGDVVLTRKLILEYFNEWEVELLPTDWLVMLDKLYTRVLPRQAKPLTRKLSRVHFWIDRRIPTSSRLSLFLSGAVLTRISRPG